jgi:hypothetical protein
VTIDAATVSPARAIAASARGEALLVVVTGPALNELTAELGGYDPAVHHLLRVATNTGRAIGVIMETGEDTSSTLFLAPRSWTPKRPRGWVAGRHEAIEGMFGAATPVAEGEW